LSRAKLGVIGCIHDEIIIEAPVTEISTAAQILYDSMVDAGKVYLKDVPVVVVRNWWEK
jgi:DNA polymerase I-like protein with 3'-5' exonuclease and polymerase domains